MHSFNEDMVYACNNIAKFDLELERSVKYERIQFEKEEPLRREERIKAREKIKQNLPDKLKHYKFFLLTSVFLFIISIVWVRGLMFYTFIAAIVFLFLTLFTGNSIKEYEKPYTEPHYTFSPSCDATRDNTYSGYSEYINPTRKQQQSYQRGLVGEILVQDELKKLSDEYFLINDIVLKKSQENIDHIVIGPSGIFLIETKTWENLHNKTVYFSEKNSYFLGRRQKEIPLSKNPIDQVNRIRSSLEFELMKIGIEKKNQCNTCFDY